MAIIRSDGWVKSATGPAVAGAQIYVCNQPANAPSSLLPTPPSPLANIFSDSAGLVPITQPIITDGFGHYDFYAASGTYTLLVYLNGVLQQNYPDQNVGGSGTTYTAGTGISIVGSVISATNVNTGTVTSVALTVPTEFAIAGSPITTLGTLAITKATQSANTVWAGPTSGGAAQPTFRALVAADVPAAAITGLGSLHGWYTNTAAATITAIGPGINFINNGTKTCTAPSATEGPLIHQVSQAIGNGQGSYYDNVGTAAQTSAARGPLKYWVARAAHGTGATLNWWIGFTDRNPGSVLMGTDPKTSNNICFYAANTGNFLGYCSDGVNSHTLDTGISADNALHTFKMTFSTGTVTFWIDGVSVGSIVTALPSTTQALWAVSTIEANALANDLEYMWWEFNN